MTARLIVTLQLDLEPPTDPSYPPLNQHELEEYLRQAIRDWGGQWPEGSNLFYTMTVRDIGVLRIQR